MKSDVVRVNYEIAQEIKRVARRLNIPPSHASVIIFFGLTNGTRNKWNMSFSEARLRYWRKELKKRLAMTL